MRNFLTQRQQSQSPSSSHHDGQSSGAIKVRNGKSWISALNSAWQGFWSRTVAPSLPNRCLVCHQSMTLPNTGICPVCLQVGLYQAPICLGCGRSMQLLQPYCGSCQQIEPIKVVAPCSYHQGLGHWVAAIKYHGQFAALPALSLALVQRIYELEQQQLLRLPQVLIPVPLHHKRLRARGFNQAWLIAAELSRLMHIPIVSNGLVRINHTKPQAGLTGRQRRKNLNNAFELVADFPYQRVALIDDVVTTGTTVNEMARLLMARHIHVQVWCLARAEAPGLLDFTG